MQYNKIYQIICDVSFIFYSYSYDLAQYHFEASHEKLRGNRHVDYQQLGFKYKLYSCEVFMKTSPRFK